VEHDGKLFCTACLKPKATPVRVRKSYANVWQPVAGFVTGWLVLYWVAQLLLLLPTAVHDK